MSNKLIDNNELMKEWNCDKNKNINLEEITHGSIKKIWWKCKYGHEWEASPNNRTRGTGCPYCNNRSLLVGFNDLKSKYPIIAEEWNYKQNSGLLPEQILYGSHKKVWWKCKTCGNEWQTTIYNRISGKGCPKCSLIKQGKTKIKNIISKEGSFADNYPNLLKEWDFNKNSVNPSELTKNSKKKVWWMCLDCNYSWMTTIYHRTIRGSKCPSCMNKVVTSNNCLSVTHPQILEKWNYEKNVHISPNDVMKGSNKKVWWICSKGHEWQAAINSVVNGTNCPICCGQKILVGYNDLATTHPNLAKEWHPQKNNIKPTEITAGSSRTKVWWICPKGHEYQTTVSNRSNGTGCSICAKELKTSFPEQAIYFYLKQHTESISRYLLNGKTEIDIYLPKFKIGIEYDGEYFHTGKEATEKENKKDLILKSNGITLIRIKELKKQIIEDSDRTIYCKYDSSYNFINDLIPKICNIIFEITGTKYNIDVNISRDISKIYSEYIESEKENSLLIKNPSLSKEWHPTLNGYIKPDMVSYASGKKVWWICPKGHEYQASINNRQKGNGCPICSGKKILVGYNDLATTHPNLSKEWHQEKNVNLSTGNVTKGSHKKVW
ncbi:MAG: hypothetical protein II309_04320, partial [Bacilli bacterium]|nr:hypothetical protein [Bacilli bacterium]